MAAASDDGKEETKIMQGDSKDDDEDDDDDDDDEEEEDTSEEKYAADHENTLKRMRDRWAEILVRSTQIFDLHLISSLSPNPPYLFLMLSLLVLILFPLHLINPPFHPQQLRHELKHGTPIDPLSVGVGGYGGVGSSASHNNKSPRQRAPSTGGGGGGSGGGRGGSGRSGARGGRQRTRSIDSFIIPDVIGGPDDTDVYAIHPGIQEHPSSSSSAATNYTSHVEGEITAPFSNVMTAAAHTSMGEQDNVASITTHAPSLVASSSFTSAQQSISPFKKGKQEEEEKK
jgi:hypothetical protein